MPLDSYTPAGQQFARDTCSSARLPDHSLPPAFNNTFNGTIPSGPRGRSSITQWFARRNPDGSSSVQDNLITNGSLGRSYRLYENNGSIMVYQHEEEDETAIRKKYVLRGWTIQQHERRLKDSNELLSQMRRRLDPDGKVMSMMGDADFRRSVARRAKHAFSKNDHVQGFFDFITAYDLTCRERTGYWPSIAHKSTSEPLAISNDERRIESMSTTIRIQGNLIQEQTETIAKLEKALATANAKALSEQQKAKNAILSSKLKRPVVSLPTATNFHSTTPSFPPENHESFTFTGFSEENHVNPARLQRMVGRDDTPSLTSGSSPYDESTPLFSQTVSKTGANTAPLGPERRRVDSAMQSSRASSVTSSHYVPRPSSARQRDMRYHRPARFSYMDDLDAPMRGASEFAERSASGSKRARDFLDYDEPGQRPDMVSKRLKSGALAPPLPEEIGVAGEMGLGSGSSGGVSIRDDGSVELEMGEILEEKTETAAGNDGAKFAIEGLDEMISQARSKALS